MVSTVSVPSTDIMLISSSANLLHPREDRDTKELLFVCSSCNNSERHDVACTYRNKLEKAAEETAGVTADVASDPTVGLPGFCTMCGEAIECALCRQQSRREEVQDSSGDDSNVS